DCDLAIDPMIQTASPGADPHAAVPAGGHGDDRVQRQGVFLCDRPKSLGSDARQALLRTHTNTQLLILVDGIDAIEMLIRCMEIEKPAVCKITHSGLRTDP